jgi:invasion protein IalB
MQPAKFLTRSGLVFAMSLIGTLSVHAQQTAAVKPDAPVTRSTRFGDWTYRCARMKAAGSKTVEPCEVVQIAQVRQGSGNANVLTLAFAKAAGEGGSKTSGGSLLLTALVPLNVVLPIGLGLAADDKDVVTVPYRNCNQAGCWAQQKLDGKMLAALQKGSAGEARLRLMNGQNINVKFSLKGLARALSELQKPSKA